jgi:hypothetical protein
MNVFMLAGFCILSTVMYLRGRPLTAAEYFHSRFHPGPSVPAVPGFPVDSAEYTALPVASAGITLSKEQKSVLRGIRKNNGHK